MNDFTKEELEKLYALCLMHDNDIVSPLRNKIQAMIDNYCEHDWKECCAEDIYYICQKCKVEKI